MALGLVAKKCVAGVLVVPNMKLAQYLTDRIGNIEEIRPYAPLWENLNIVEGVLELVVIEQDADMLKPVPKIPKGKDGRAAEGMLSAPDEGLFNLDVVGVAMVSYVVVQQSFLICWAKSSSMPIQ